MIWDTWEGWTLRWQHVRGSNTMYRTSSNIMPLIWKLEPQIQNAEWGSNGLSKCIRSSQRFCGLRLTVTRKLSTVSYGCSRWRGVLGSLVMSMAVGAGRQSIILAVSHTRAGSLRSVLCKNLKMRCGHNGNTSEQWAGTTRAWNLSLGEKIGGRWDA